jgi:hypothetical protein
MSVRGRRRADPRDHAGRAPPYGRPPEKPNERSTMLWLVIGVILLIIAIAGGVIVHPLLFALAILALVVFFVGGRGGRTAV